jgi:hypothetical protein
MPICLAIDRVDQCVASFGGGLQRRDHHGLDLLVGDRPRPARPRLVEQPLEALGRKPIAPLGDRQTRHTLALGDLRVGQLIGGGEHDPGSQRERLRGLAPAPPRLQRRSLLFRQSDLNSGRNRHNPSLP